MVLTEEHYQKIREELINCKRPLFFFDDDPDGLCSFLLLYRFKKEGAGVCVKSKPILDTFYLRKVKEYDPDKIFILDKPMVAQEFVDQVKVPVIYVDHHDPQDLDNVKYFNPRLVGDKKSTPVAYICYKVVLQDLWIATVGAIADWYMPEYASEFAKQYPDLLDPKIKKPEVALFDTELGKLIQIFAFCLKGKTSEVKKCYKTLTRINGPYEILKQASSPGKFIHKKFERVISVYENVLNSALKEIKKSRGKLFVFKYAEDKVAFSSELSNYLMYKYPNKIIMVARLKSGEYKLSLRSTSVTVKDKLEKALVGIKGYGGGHEHACGACVDEEFFNQFIDNLKRQL